MIRFVFFSDTHPLEGSNPYRLDLPQRTDRGFILEIIEHTPAYRADGKFDAETQRIFNQVAEYAQAHDRQVMMCPAPV